MRLSWFHALLFLVNRSSLLHFSHGSSRCNHARRMMDFKRSLYYEVLDLHDPEQLSRFPVKNIRDEDPTTHWCSANAEVDLPTHRT